MPPIHVRFPSFVGRPARTNYVTACGEDSPGAMVTSDPLTFSVLHPSLDLCPACGRIVRAIVADLFRYRDFVGLPDGERPAANSVRK